RSRVSSWSPPSRCPQPNVIRSPIATLPRGERTACLLEGTTPGLRRHFVGRAVTARPRALEPCTRLPQRKPWRAGRVAVGRRTARCYAHPMLRPMPVLPEGVLGFEATGEIQASDYRDVLMPAVREVWERGDEVRIVLVFERWDGMSSGAAWEDLKVGMKNLT